MTEKHFNGLTPAEAERLAMLSEEAGEIVQAVGKILRHGYESTHPAGGPTNREALLHEIHDIRVIISMMSARNDIDLRTMRAEYMEHYNAKAKYMHHQEDDNG